jgi:hypothetical protein
VSSDIDRAAGIADLRVEERLYRYIVGGVDSDETRRTRESNDRFSLPSLNEWWRQREVLNHFREINNTDVTRPAVLPWPNVRTSNQNISSSIATALSP